MKRKSPTRMRPREPFDVRFWRQVDRDPEQWTCWLWTGATDSTGYGQISQRNGTSSSVTMRAHRMAWILVRREPIPENMQVLHRCDEPSCVNPAHLFLGTIKDNMSDLAKKRKNFHQRKTRCAAGHDYDHANTYILIQSNGRPRRQCRICRATSQRAYAARMGT